MFRLGSCHTNAWHHTSHHIISGETYYLQFSSVQSLSHAWLIETPWTAARQAFPSITNSRSPPKPMSIESVMLSTHLILCPPLLLLPSIFPSIMVFTSELALHIRWPKYWSFSFSISPSNEHSGLIAVCLLKLKNQHWYIAINERLYFNFIGFFLWISSFCLRIQHRIPHCF